MTRLGVVGGGTMGSGIVQVAAQQGMDVVLLDVRQDLLDGTLNRIQGFIQRGVERGRMSQDDADAVVARIKTTTDFADLSDVDCVIEAVLENIETKGAVFSSLDAHCPPGAVLATNTSSLSIAEIAAVTKRPESVVGLHFFNPVPLMALVEVIRGSATSDATIERAVSIARELGKTPVRAEDTPGFIVNRVVRPFYNEALRILNDGIASVQDIDRAMKGVGFRMGPFELMDLIGNDVNFAVTSSIYEQFFGDPKYRPSFRQQRMVQGGFLGQKTKRGWYDYTDGERSVEPATPAVTSAPLRSAVVASDSAFGGELADALRAANVGVTLVPIDDTPIDIATLISYAGAPDAIIDVCIGSAVRKGALIQALDDAPGNAPVLSMITSVGATGVASWSRHPESVCGFGYLPPLADSKVVEIAPALQSGPAAIEAVHRLTAALNREPVVLRADAPGLIGPRIVALIANEAAFALQEGVASREDIDAAVRLGANYPFGPLEWADRLGLDLTYAIIAALQNELGEDRYRPSPLLRRMYQAAWYGRAIGRGFYTYERS